MIRLAGELSLVLALLACFIQGIVPLLGYFRKSPHLLAFAGPSAYAQFIFVLIAYGLLTIAFGISDFSIAYVAANSHPSLPLMYRLTAVWGSHEGSILLWIFILNIWTLVFALINKKISAASSSLTLSILGLISFCFLAFLLFTSNPFIAAPELQSGNDLNPLLQDPGFVIHPPMLYTGYVGFSLAFALTLSALIQGKLDRLWARLTRQFALAAFSFLSFGIMLGSWWAYRVLGWGGFWFWDPVENASLLPWLSGTALIHVLVLAEKTNTAKTWAALLAIISFALSLLGTFLVRSGVLVSVHTFASDPTRGVFLLALLGVLITAALLVYVFRFPGKDQAFSPLSFLSREMALLLNSALLFICMLTVLLGTLYPLIMDALHLASISVGPPYFNKVLMPLTFIIMAFMGVGVLLHWQQASLPSMLNMTKKLLFAIASAIILLWAVTDTLDLIPIISLSLSFWIIFSLQNLLRFYPGMALAHAGFAILVIGIMLSSLLNLERNIRIKPGDTTTLGPYQFYFLHTKGVDGPNYRGIQAAFEVKKNQRHIATMLPEKRIYTVREMIMTKVDIHPGIFRDLYIALGEPLPDDFWSLRIYYKPFIRWIWFGGIIMILGGILAMFQGRPGVRQ